MNFREQFDNENDYREFCQSYERYIDQLSEEFYEQESSNHIAFVSFDVSKKFEEEQKTSFESLFI